MQAAGGAEHHGIGIAALEHLLDLRVRGGAGPVYGLLKRPRIRVANRNEFSSFRMLANRIEVVLRDPAAPDKRKPDLAIVDRWISIEHSALLPLSLKKTLIYQQRSMRRSFSYEIVNEAADADRV